MPETENKSAMHPLASTSEFRAEFPNNLPIAITSFIGRECELRQALRWLKDARLLTLKGPGGCGKTRLALQVAAESLQDFAGGVWLVEIAHLTDPDTIPLAIAANLGMREIAGSDICHALIQFLEKRSALLIIDNCEHLRSACAAVIEKIVRSCPHTRILATSRDNLGISGEVTVEVPTLALPPEKTAYTVGELEEIESVRLFVDRARAASSRFLLKPSNAAAVARICRQLDGLPLAIELAAAHVRVMSVPEIAADLLALLEESTSLSSTAPDRHRTLNSLIEWSVRLLKPEEKSLLMRLAVFAGGWDRTAAFAVCGSADDTERKIGARLSRLVEVSLAARLTTEEDDEESAGVLPTRYSLLKTVRAYAQKQLSESGESSEIAERFVSYYLGIAEQAEPYLTGNRQGPALTTLDCEREKLRAALDLSVTSSETRLRLTGALWRYWIMRSHFTEGHARLQQALAHTKSAKPAVVAKALNGAGVHALRQGDYASAQQWFDQSRTVYEQAGDLAGIAEVLNNLGHVFLAKGNRQTALTCYEESLERHRQTGSRWGEAAALSSLGMIQRDEQTLELSRAHFESALAIWRDLGDDFQIAAMLSNLGMVLYDQEDYVGARLLFTESLERYREQNNAWGEAFVLNNLATTLQTTRSSRSARLLLQQSIALFHRIGERKGIIYPLMGLATNACDAGEQELAVRICAVVEDISRQTNTPLPSTEQDSFNRMLDQLRQSQPEEAFKYAWEAGKSAGVEDIVRSV